MAQNASNDLVFYLLLDSTFQHKLGSMRTWTNLKVGFDANQIWVKDLNYAQINSLEVKTIPQKKIYYEQTGKLFRLNSLLPELNAPSTLWTPIDRAFPLTLPQFNHNYFGISDKIHLRIVNSAYEKNSNAFTTKIEILKNYIENSPAIRLQYLNWLVYDDDKVLILGSPPLPIAGNSFWSRGDSILPAGYDFELPLLEDSINSLINPARLYWILWQPDSSYFLFPKSDFVPLSISSFRMTLRSLSNK